MNCTAVAFRGGTARWGVPYSGNTGCQGVEEAVQAGSPPVFPELCTATTWREAGKGRTPQRPPPHDSQTDGGETEVGLIGGELLAVLARQLIEEPVVREALEVEVRLSGFRGLLVPVDRSG